MPNSTSSTRADAGTNLPGGTRRKGSDGTLTPERLGAIVAAATGLIAGVGALTLTGALGRVQRNHGAWFAAAVTSVLVGAAIFALATNIDEDYEVPKRPAWWRGALRRIAAILAVVGLIVLGLILADSLPSGQGPAVGDGGVWVASLLVLAVGEIYGATHLHVGWRESVQVFGAALLAIGIIIAFVFAIAAAGETEQPQVTLTLSADAASVSGTAKVGDLSSRDRLSVYIDGLIRKGNNYQQTQLYKAFVGPDSNGNASDNVSVSIPPDEFEAIGISAYTTRNPAGCGSYPTGQQGQKQGTGCAVIQLPDRRPAPDLSASWEGASSSNIMSISLTASAARVSKTGGSILLLVAGAAGHSTTTLYIALLTPSSGTITRDIRLAFSPGLRMICVEAQVVGWDGKFPLAATCPLRTTPVRLDSASASGTAVVELQPPTIPTIPTIPTANADNDGWRLGHSRPGDGDIEHFGG